MGEIPEFTTRPELAGTFGMVASTDWPPPAAFTSLGLDLVPGSGLLAACVPGAFGAWMLMLREFGTLRLRDVLGYAIGYAARGYPLVPAISWGIASVADLFRDHWPGSAEVYLPGGQV